MTFRFISERNIYIWLILILSFLWLTFNRDLATIYSLFIILDYIIFDNYKGQLKFGVNQIPGNSITALTKAIFAYVVFLVFSAGITFVFQQVSGQTTMEWINQILRFFHSTVPILADSVFLTIVGFGVLVSIIETRMFFGRIFELLAMASNTSLNSLKNNWRLWGLMAFIASMFTWFHFETRNLGKDQVGLIMTFIFAMISMYLVVKDRELESAIDLHVITNTTTILNKIYGGLNALPI